MPPLQRTLPALLCLALSLPVTAPAAVVSGIGSRDCQSYMRALEINSREALDAYIAWGQGYLSGYDDARPGSLHVAVDGESLSYWLIDYCSAQPERSVYQALQAFIARQTR
jgi:hypothetical protein